MSNEGIIADQSVKRVRRVKQERARELRRTMTPEESLLWQQLRAHRFDGLHWRRQQVIAGFIADFYCHAARVIVEIDGTIHIRQAEYDKARDELLAARDLLILRFTNIEVTDTLADVLARIRTTCQVRTRS
jgi:very-short-patch-repair endonuclease